MIPAQRDPFEDAGVYRGPEYGQNTGVAQLGTAPGTVSPQVDGLRGLLVPRSQIGRIPKPVPLIQGTLWRDTDAWLIGASGSGKSFIALDWAAHVAAGAQWNNRRTAQGRVLYLVAEGASGMQQRLDAWEMARREAAKRAADAEQAFDGPTVIPDDLILLPAPVQAVIRVGRTVELSPAWRELMGIVAEMAPALIVLDTQARISLGLNENDNAEMGQFIEAVGALRRHAAGAALVVVHHTGRNGGDARGASAIDGAQDVEWKVERKPGQMFGELVMEKNKNGADGVRHPFAFKLHKLCFDSVAQEEVTSLSLSFDAFDLPGGTGEPEHRTMAAAVAGQILEILREGSLTTGATKTEIRMKVNLLRKSLGQPEATRRTIDYALDQPNKGRAPGLLQNDLVVQIGQRFVDRERHDQA